MNCPICDQKAINCDCTAAERRQFLEMSDMEDEMESLRAEIARLRLTDEEREAVVYFAKFVWPSTGRLKDCAATLRDLLERL